MFNQVRLINVLLFLLICSLWISLYLNNLILIENTNHITKQTQSLIQKSINISSLKKNYNFPKLEPELEPEQLKIILPVELQDNNFIFIPGIPD